MINPEDFFDQVAAVTKHQIGDRRVRIGYIDSAFEEGRYPEIQPRVYLDGEGLTHRGYPCISSYVPMRGDRVVLLPVGENYVILGSIERSDRDMLRPGQLVFFAESNAAISMPPGDGAGAPAWWDTVHTDLLGALNFDGVTTSSANENPPMTRFQPPVPGWYSLSGAIGFSTAGQGNWRRARWVRNGTIVGGGHWSFARPAAGQASAPAPVMPIAMNGTTDYLELWGVHDSDANITMSTGTLRPFMSVTYSGPLNTGAGPSLLNLE